MVLGAHEQDSSACSGGQDEHQGLLCVSVSSLKHVVGHLGNRGIGIVNSVHNLVLQELIYEFLHPVIQGGREQQSLTGSWGGI